MSYHEGQRVTSPNEPGRWYGHLDGKHPDYARGETFAKMWRVVYEAGTTKSQYMREDIDFVAVSAAHVPMSGENFRRLMFNEWPADEEGD